MSPKAKPTAPQSDADAPVAPSVRRKTRNTTKGKTSDEEAPPATFGRKTRQQMKASPSEQDSNLGEMSNLSTQYGENDPQIPRGTGTKNCKTPAKELAHVEETTEADAMQSSALEFPGNEFTSTEAPIEAPGTGPASTETLGAPEPKDKGKARNSLDEALSVEDASPKPKEGSSAPQANPRIQQHSLTVPPGQDPEPHTATLVPANLSFGPYLHPPNEQCLRRRRKILNRRLSISRLEIEEMEEEVKHINETLGNMRVEDRVDQA